MAGDATDVPIRSTKAPYLWQMPEHTGHYAGRARRNQWGHVPMILFLTDLSLVWSRMTGGAAPFGLGDISLDNATAPYDHLSHTHGACADIYVMNMTGARRSDGAHKITYADPAYAFMLQRALTRTILQVLKRGYKVHQFFFNDPLIQKLAPGMIRTKEKHDDHIHIQLLRGSPYGKAEMEVLQTPMDAREIPRLPEA